MSFIKGKIILSKSGELLFGVSVPDGCSPQCVEAVLKGVAVISTWMPKGEHSIHTTLDPLPSKVSSEHLDQVQNELMAAFSAES